jgi:hypothetical protein
MSGTFYNGGRTVSEALVSDRQQSEIPLLGGTANRGKVVRVGNTVRRPLRRTSPATHALLCHLTDIGFDGAPRFIGIDSQQREVLSYIPGTAVTPPYPDWALTDEALVSVAELLRAYHQAARTFDCTSYAWPSSPPEAYKGDLISHNDPNLDNVVFRAGKAVALIDFDLASPGCRLWDIACAARLWAPLRPACYISDIRCGRVLGRFRLFVTATGWVTPTDYESWTPLHRTTIGAMTTSGTMLRTAISLSLNIGMQRRRSELTGFASGTSRTDQPCRPHSSDPAGSARGL